jgi:hypothetical protein
VLESILSLNFIYREVNEIGPTWSHLGYYYLSVLDPKNQRKGKSSNFISYGAGDNKNWIFTLTMLLRRCVLKINVLDALQVEVYLLE